MTWRECIERDGLPVPTRERVDRVGFTPAERRALHKHWPREDTPNISEAGYDPSSSQVVRA